LLLAIEYLLSTAWWSICDRLLFHPFAIYVPVFTFFSFVWLPEPPTDEPSALRIALWIFITGGHLFLSIATYIYTSLPYVTYFRGAEARHTLFLNVNCSFSVFIATLGLLYYEIRGAETERHLVAAGRTQREE
jgi:hypothetical protein